MPFFENKTSIIKTIKIILCFAIFYLAITYLGTYFSPFIIGYILCICLYPLFKIFHNAYKIPKPLSSILCITIFILSVTVVGVGIVGQIVKEGKEFIKDIPYYIESIKNTFNSVNLKIERFISILPDGLEKIISSFSDNATALIGDLLGNGIKSTSIKVIKKVPNFFMIIVISLISCYLMLMDKENIQAFVLRQIPDKYKPKLFAIKTGIGEAVFGYIKAQAIIMCLISTVCFLGLCIIRAPYALFVAFIIGFVDALPVFGSGLVLWPWAIYNVITNNYGMAVGLIIIYVVILITRQFVEPRIIGKQIGIHPLLTLMSIYIGLKIFGIFGFIIGPILMVIIKAMQDENVLPKWR